ncbi:MAG: alpha-L-fucosidase [Armatimonadetes bacterium]|nr:alpha-L-fucosidase [Armatimonadota bacterium]
MRFRFNDARDWFFEKRFGLFVHWGLYAVPGWHEQHLYRKGMRRSDYAALIGRFNPVRFDPDAWLDLAEEAGMEYVCFTAKHIDGFCMWATDETPYNVMNTPYARDILAALAEACHRRGFPLCLYYSIVDEHHPSYPNAGRAYELPAPDPGDDPDEERYMAFLTRQVRELCTRYGEIGGFWWDANILGRRDPSVNAMIRSLQPGAVINDRGFDEGDFGTPERDYADSAREMARFETPVEACQSVGSQSWGYRADEDYYTDAHLIRHIDRILSKGGNYLLNVGPRPDGTFPEGPVAILRRLGAWYRSVRESFIGCEPASGLASNRDVLLTRRGDTLYVHLHREPPATAVLLHPIERLPYRAVLLNTGQPVEADVEALPGCHHLTPNRCLRLKNLPVNGITAAGYVIRLDFEGPG